MPRNRRASVPQAKTFTGLAASRVGLILEPIMKTKKTAKPFEFDFEGEYDPLNPNRINLRHSKTFSVGVFQWIPMANGKGLKKSKCLKRIRGISARPEIVHEKARQECETYQSAFGFNLHPGL